MIKTLLSIMLSVVSLNAVSGDAENISACVNKAKEFSGVVLNEFDARYQGNILARSVAKWPNALCEIKLGKVYTLEVNSNVYIYEGFAGKESYDLNRSLQAKTDDAIKLLNSRIALLQQRSSQVSVSLSKPNPDHQYLTNYIMQGIEQSVGKGSAVSNKKTTSENNVSTRTVPVKSANLAKSDNSEKEVLIPRSVNGDQGKYYLISSKSDGEIISTLHKRVGLDATGYTKAEINCSNMTIREMGYSEVSANDIQENPGTWNDLIKGSSKSDLVNFVCKS